jgi:PRC-barrel domain
MMTRSIALLAGAAVFVAILCGSAFSQGTPQTLSLMKVDPQTLATGYRTSKVVGSTVVNEANETVGTIDDLIVTPGEKVPFAVLSIGGFLGMGTKYVVVPYSSLEVHDKKMVLPGATKESLKSLPEFIYTP